MERFLPLWILLALGALLLSSSGLQVLWPAIALVATTLAALAWMRRRRSGGCGRGRHAGLELLLLVTLLFASITGLRLSRTATYNDGVWLRRARVQLDAGAMVVRERLLALQVQAHRRAEQALRKEFALEELARPLKLAGSELRVGISLWRDGRIIDWAGEVPGPERVPSSNRPLLVDHGFRRYLTVSAQDEQGLTAFFDLSLGITRELFPRLGLGVDPGKPLAERTGLDAQLRASAPQPEEIAPQLERVVAVPEMDPWAWVVLRAPTIREERRLILRHEGRILAWAILFALALAVGRAWQSWGGWRGGRRQVWTTLAFVLLLVFFRFGVDRAKLLELAFSTGHGGLRWLLEPAYFATTWGFGLFRSVLDFFVTSVTIALVFLLLLPLWLRWLSSRRGRMASAASLFVLMLLSLVALRWIPLLQQLVAQNANPKLVGLDAPFFTFSFQILHWAMLLAFVAPVGFAFLGWERWLRERFGRGPIALAAGFLLASILVLSGGDISLSIWLSLLPLLAVVVSPAVQHPSFSVRVVAALVLVLWLSWTQAEGLRRVYRQLKEDVATERALDRLHPRDNWRKILVEEFLRELADDPSRLRNFIDSQADRSNAAFELWAGSSSLSALGYGSRIVLFDPEGRVLSDFDLGLPYPPRPATAPASVPVENQPFTVGSIQLRSAAGTFLVYRGWLDVRRIFPEGGLGWVRVDLPYGTADPATSFDLSTGSGPLALGFAVGGDLLAPRREFERPVILGRWGGDKVVAATEPVLVGLHRAQLPQDGSWVSIRRDNEPYRARLILEGGEALAVAFALPTLNERLLDATRLVALYLVAGALGLVLLLMGVALRPGSRRWPAVLGRLGYQERLLGAIVILVLLPVIVFGVFQSRRAEANLRRSNREEVARRLDTALRLLADGLDDAVRARLEVNPLESFLSGQVSRDEGNPPPLERDQLMVFGPQGEVLHDESGRDLARPSATRLLHELQGVALVLEDDEQGWYLGRLFDELSAGGQHCWVYLRRRVQDEDLRRLARTVGADLTLFDGAWAVVSSRDDLLKAGLVVPVLPSDAQRILRTGGSPRYLATEPDAGLVVARGYVRLPGPRDPRRGVLAARLFTQATVAALEQRRSYLFLFGLSSLAFLLATVVGLVVAARTVNPILVLLGATEQVGAGDLSVRLPEKGDDEIGQLTHSFNRMTQQLEQGQSALASRRSFLETMLASLSAGVLILDQKLELVESNHAAQEMGEKALDRLLSHLRAMELPVEVQATEIVLEGEDGPRTLRTVLSPIQLEEGERGWLVLFDDVTELLSSRRLTLYAEMARQVAHEVKNPLTPIQLAAQMVRQACHDGHPRMVELVDENTGQIERQVERLREIASEFSLLGRTETLQLQAVEISSILDEIRLLYPSIDERLSLRVEGGRGLYVLADREAMLKVLTNLVANARQAMGEEGKVEVIASLVDDRVILRVLDEGGGIAPQVEEHLFEAYFSTKSYGTGLGLIICRNLVEKMGGSIHLTNRVGGPGAEATVGLPLHRPGQD